MVMGDFPAAHSMDTLWFAVDRDGRVAVFSSGEAGAVPTSAYLGEDFGEVLDQLPVGPHGRSLHDLAGHVRPGTQSRHVEPGDSPWGGVLMVLASPELAAAEITAGRARKVSTTDGEGVAFTSFPLELWKSAHERGDCKGCCPWFDNSPETIESAALRAGFYLYDHDASENWCAGPYGRTRTPESPATLDELPPKVRETIARTRLDLSFAKTPSIQPLDFGPCEAWGAASLSADGRRIRAIPGREQDYADEFEELKSVEGDLEVDPPSVSPRPRKPAAAPASLAPAPLATDRPLGTPEGGRGISPWLLILIPIAYILVRILARFMFK